MKTLICSLLVALALAGCGGSSSGNTSSTSGSPITGQSTCTEWNHLTRSEATKAKNSYLQSKNLETGKGSEGEALSAWIDYLCGATNRETPFSPQTSIDDVFAAAESNFTAGQTFPPVNGTQPTP